MASANSGNAPFPPAVPHEEEPEQVSESEPEEESEEEPLGDAEGANSYTDSRETVAYSIAYREDTRTVTQEAVPFESSRIGESSHQVRPQEVRPNEPTIPPNTERSEPQPDLEAQPSKSTNEDSDAIMKALDDRLVHL
ncbi:hypothetical protein L1987_32925 [Smallanthus sonchifolius]|uniref:Uncharacterized protein n=1 Tax=Smallanthus sonchifolius TaxID=185202 RepID=A0ACB9HP42_9ASTR|nr:hypothetical protein L1987_32925 [Smallanthus sonchifolius]